MKEPKFAACVARSMSASSQHDQRILAAELDAALLQMRAGLGRDLAADRGRAGEGDALHVGMLDQFVADLLHIVARAGDDVENAFRKAGLLEHFGEQQAAAIGRLFRRLQHDGVAGREREQRSRAPTGCTGNSTG